MADGGLWTQLHSSQVTTRTFGVLAGLPAETVVASEYDQLAAPGPAEGLLTIAVSQSGETSDLLDALENVDSPVLAITNRPHSSLARRSNAVLESSAGPEIGVAATKTFTTQVAAGAALALAYPAATGSLGPMAVARHGLRLGALPGRLESAHTSMRGSEGHRRCQPAYGRPGGDGLAGGPHRGPALLWLGLCPPAGPRGSGGRQGCAAATVRGRTGAAGAGREDHRGHRRARRRHVRGRCRVVGGSGVGLGFHGSALGVGR